MKIFTQVNVVTVGHKMNEDVPHDCADGLFIATSANVLFLKQYVQHITPHTGMQLTFPNKLIWL